MCLRCPAIFFFQWWRRLYVRSVFVHHVHLPPAVYLPVHVGEQRSLLRCCLSYNSSRYCHVGICSWKDGLTEHKGPSVWHAFMISHVIYLTGCSMSKDFLVSVVQSRQSTRWSFTVSTSDRFQHERKCWGWGCLLSYVTLSFVGWNYLREFF